MAIRIATISLACASMLALAACGTKGAWVEHKVALLDRIDAMDCPELAVERERLGASISENEVAEIGKDAAITGGVFACAVATAGICGLAAGPVLGAADVDLAARARADYVEVRRLEVYRCPKSKVVQASVINPAR